MEDLLTELRELGVYIPYGLDDAQLLNLAKALCPWTLSTGMSVDGCYSTTRKKQLTEAEDESTCYARTEAEAAIKLLLKQLQGQRYTANDTRYKQAAMTFRATNP